MERIPALIEQIFAENPPDDNCDAIAAGMDMTENHINELLKAGCHEQSAILFLQLATAIARHFMDDAHWEYFDDDYAPQYVMDRLSRTFQGEITRNTLTAQAKETLERGIQKLSETESVREYGYPRITLDLKG